MPATPPPPGALAFRNVTVVDVKSGKRHPEQTVVIAGNRIQAVGATRTTQVPAGARIVDARGEFLIPGLWDLHVHSGGLKSLPIFILAGVTGVRYAGGVEWYDGPDDTTHRSAATLKPVLQEILAGTRVGPPRHILTGTGFGVADDEYVSSQDSDGVRTIVRLAKAGGFDMLDEAVGTENRQVYLFMVAEARRAGLGTGGHIPEFLSALAASDSGVSLIEHTGVTSGGLERMCNPRYPTATLVTCRKAAERLRRNNAWWVLTLVHMPFVGAYDDSAPGTPGARARRIAGSGVHSGMSRCRPRDWLPEAARFEPNAPPNSFGPLRLVARVGMPILAGSHGDGMPIHNELALMVAQGLTPLAALQTATLNPARWLRATDSLGTVEAGKLADLVLLDADPLIDITNTTKIRAVIANGHYYDHAALDQIEAAIPDTTWWGCSKYK